MLCAVRFVVAFALLTLDVGCAGSGSKDGGLSLSSAAFSANGPIPERHTCEGDDLSPPLEWSGLPAGTESLALIIDDPDAPGRTAVHWVLYNIPVSATGLPETEWGSGLPDSVREGLNDFGRTQYGGPCPPAGRHRYFHKLFALDTILPDLHKPDKRRLERAMEGHVLAEAELIGTYELGV